jgi:hypothetical protein
VRGIDQEVHSALERQQRLSLEGIAGGLTLILARTLVTILIDASCVDLPNKPSQDANGECCGWQPFGHPRYLPCSI